MKFIKENWYINYNELKHLQNHVWDIDNEYILKGFDANWIKNLEMISILRYNGLPTFEIIPCTNGDNYYINDGVYYCLYSKLKGHHLNDEEVVTDEKMSYKLGQIIGNLHRVFNKITEDLDLWDNNYLDEINGWIQNTLENKAKGSYAYSIFKDINEELTLVYPQLKRHMIHRDMHLGNLLIDNGNLSGYIDFDLMQINSRIFDIAYITCGWLLDRLDDNVFLEQWKSSLKLIVEGYSSIEPLSDIEMRSIPLMMCALELLFVAFHYTRDDEDNISISEQTLKWLWENKVDITP